MILLAALRLVELADWCDGSCARRTPAFGSTMRGSKVRPGQLLERGEADIDAART